MCVQTSYTCSITACGRKSSSAHYKALASMLKHKLGWAVFRSAPDTWAIRQVFPIVPLHRLGEEPSVAATLADLTCDSDGKIDAFIAPDGPDPAPVLPLHTLLAGQPYLLAMLLTGVYQEVSEPNSHKVRGCAEQFGQPKSDAACILMQLLRLQPTVNAKSYLLRVRFTRKEDKFLKTLPGP